MRFLLLFFLLSGAVAVPVRAQMYYASPGVPHLLPTPNYPHELKDNEPGLLRQRDYEAGAMQAIHEKFKGQFPLMNYHTARHATVFMAATQPPTPMVQVFLSAIITSQGGVIGRNLIRTETGARRSWIIVTMRKDLSKVYLDFSRSGF